MGQMLVERGGSAEETVLEMGRLVLQALHAHTRAEQVQPK